MAKYTRYINPQSIITMFGLFMFVMSGLGFAASSSSLPDVQETRQSTQLQVQPAQGSPTPAINQLQGASSLQGQGNQGLQRPVGEQLQPNAKTSNINATQTVQ